MNIDKSLPSRERGLKLCVGVWLLSQSGVAPFTGAWIETDTVIAPPLIICSSLPSRERGLKPSIGKTCP